MKGFPKNLWVANANIANFLRGITYLTFSMPYRTYVRGYLDYFQNGQSAWIVTYTYFV